AVLGCVLEGLPAVVLFAPLMFPIAKQFGVHEVHYSVIAILAMGVGLFTPPFGIGFYITCAIGGADPDKPFRARRGFRIQDGTFESRGASVPQASARSVGSDLEGDRRQDEAEHLP